MVTLIEGRSGSGKTARLYEKLAEAVRNGEEKVMYLMPEQSSFECETRFLHLLGAADAQKVKVMSFTRLYYLVMSETGAPSGEAIDDNIRRMIMSCTLEDIADELSLYKDQAKKPQFAEVASNAVKELKQCGITPDVLRDTAAEAGSAELSKKLRELSLIYSAFNANVAVSGVDPYDNDIRLEKRIAETNFFDGYIVAVDDFSGFTAQQHKIIELMMAQSKDIYFSLCKDIADGTELFYTVERTKKRLMRSAAARGKKLSHECDLAENVRTNSETLKYLEENIYSRTTEGSIDDVPEQELSRDVTVVQAADVYEECEYIAARINDLALTDKRECRYRDIAVVFRNSERYVGVIDDVFKKCSIPFFMSRPQQAETKPLMRLVCAALDYAMSPNDENKLLTAVKSGIFGVSAFDAAKLENYVYMWGLKGRSFFAPFDKHPRGFEPKMTKFDENELKCLNETREKIAEPFSKLLAALKSEDGKFESKDISAALYSFLTDSKVDKRIQGRMAGQEEFAEEEARLWDMLVEMFDKMHSALGTRRLTLRRYNELFRLMLKGTTFSDIPQTLDQVMIGKADSIRFQKPYAVFIVGAVDGEFPHIPVPDGVFSDMERRDLIDIGLPLYDSVADLFRQEKFFVYNAVSAPTDRLIVSYPSSGLSGEVFKPSAIISEVLRVLPKLKMINASDVDELMSINGMRSAFEHYARTHKNDSAFTRALEKHLSESEEYSDMLPQLGADIKNISRQLKDEAAPAAVFGKDKYLSATQIESFYECRFKYFCSYGISLRDRQKAQLDRRIYGNLIHFILENVIKEYKERDYAPFGDGELEKLLDDLLDVFMETELGGSGDKTERFRSIYYRSRRRVWRVLSNMLDEFAHSGFKPVDAELKLGKGSALGEYTLKTKEKNTVSICGKVDRIDMLDNGGVRIIDYKSGGKDFSVEETVYGLSLQMLIYLCAVTENGGGYYGRELSPAAVFYMKSDSGPVSVDDFGAGEEDIARLAEEKKKKALLLNGIYVDDEQVVGALDADYIDSADESRVPLSKLIALFNCVKGKIVGMSDALDEGSIEAVPIRTSSQQPKACAYCDFADICRREKTDAYLQMSKESAEKQLGEYEKSEETEDTTEKNTEKNTVEKEDESDGI